MRKATCILLVVVATMTAAVAAPTSTEPAVASPSPQVGAIEDVLPPGARQALAVVRIFRGIRARNQVYREARGVQGDLREHNQALIATAQRQLANSRELGLDRSQQAALYRATLKLKGDLDAALALTEDEKRAAKYGFESKLVNELGEALIRVPRIRRGLERTRAAVDDLKGAFERARAALEGGNPVTAFVEEVRSELERVDRVARIGSLVSGEFGRRLSRISDTVRAELDKVEQGIDQATGAAELAVAELGEVTSGIDRSLDESRRVRADLALEQAIGSTLERVLTPRSSSPERDVIADAIARDALTAAQRNVGVAAGVIDASELRTMRDRVQAAMLGRSLERIGEICGRIVGALRRVDLDAAAAGEPPVAATTPCTLFGDKDELQALIDAENSDPSAATTLPDTDGSTVPEPTEWNGSMELVPDAPDWFEPFGPQEVTIVRTPGANEFTMTLVTGDQKQKEYALTSEGFERLGTFDPNICETQTTLGFEGTGELVGDAAGLHIDFRGFASSIEERVSCTLEELGPYVREPFEQGVWVTITDTGLEGAYNYHTFSMPGVPSFTGP